MDAVLRQIDGYCERTDPSYWAEPINAVTNAAFLIAALVMWGRVHDRLGRLLCAVLCAIGVGSYLFHTHATVWAVILDVVPIGIFSLIYIFAANWRFWGLSVPVALIATAAYFPFSFAVSWLAGQVPFFQISAAYWPLAVMIALYGVALLRRAPATGRGLVIGAAILTASLVARSLDKTLCASWPIGTHFAWHILNGILLGWMIEVYRRHMLAVPASRG